MSLLIATGQCGNQLGSALNESLFTELSRQPEFNPDLDLYFRPSKATAGKHLARTVCIDTEPKVIKDVVGKRGRASQPWGYDPASCVYRYGGAGNNWSVGYQMCSGEFLEESLDKIQRELEHNDVSPVLTLVHSIAGGTGSGLGTAMTEAIADSYSSLTRMNIVVAPYTFGEVVVQNYNAVLSFAKVSRASHGVLVFENEVAHDLTTNMRGIAQPSMSDLNKTIASNIVPFMIPKYGVSRSGRQKRVHLSDDIMHLAADPCYRFLDVRATPLTYDKSIDFTFDSWPSIMNTLYGMQMTGSFSERGLVSRVNQAKKSGNVMRSLASVLVCRGSGADAATQSDGSFYNSPFNIPEELSRLYCDRLHSDSPVKAYHSPHFTNGYRHSSVLLSNSQACLPVLQRVSSKAIELFKVGAYLHQYDSHGVSTEDFRESFMEVGQIIQNYKSL